MIISRELYPTCFWHDDCETRPGSGVMQEVKREETRSVFKCLSCGKSGYYPVGGSGCVRSEEVADFPPETRDSTRAGEDK